MNISSFLKIIGCLFILQIIYSPTSTAQIDNHFSGTNAGNGVSTGDYNTAYGYKAFSNADAFRVSIFGSNAGLEAKDDATIIGLHAGRYDNYRSVIIGVGSASKSVVDIGKNTTIGHLTGYSLTTGEQNVFIGENAGYSMTTGSNAVFIGINAGYSASDESADDNILIGNNTGYNLVAEGNIIIGNDAVNYGNGAAGNLLTIGQYNILMGTSAGSALTTSNYNTFIGTGAGANATTAEPNTFIGGLSGYNTNNNYNTFVGYKSGYTNVSGHRNTVFGYEADMVQDFLGNNIIIGASASIDNNYTTVIGYDGSVRGAWAVGIGGNIITDGDGGIGIGYQTDIDPLADYSTGIGHQADIKGSYSVGIGYQVNVSQTQSVSIGASTTVSGQNSTVIGASSSATADNATVIGYNITNSNANQINLGNDDIMSIGGVMNWTTTSDGRLKTDIKEDVMGLDFILKLRPVTYEFNNRGLLNFESLVNLPPNRFTGFIAQEVEQVAQSLNYDFSGIDKPQTESDRYGLRYAQFTVPLVKAVQELSQKTERLDNANQRIDKKTASMDALLEELNAEIETLNN